jgi:hypothetical protein
MQTDWGGEYEKLHGFFQKIALLTMSHALMRINKMVPLSANIVILLKLVLPCLQMRLCHLNSGMKLFLQLLFLLTFFPVR